MKNKMEVYEKAIDSRVIAILRKFDVSKVIPLVHALVDGGLTAMEVTMDTPGALAAITQVRKEFGQKIAIGAGTILDPETGRAALLAGAQFLVAPNLNPEVIRLGNRYNRLVMPGCLTPTEIAQAYEAGADIVKVFPASSLGPDYFKQVKGPLDHVTLMATGGVSADNAAQFRANGADILGVGGNLVNAQLVAEERFDSITDYARQILTAAR